jgi:HTH-type transcriptional regulator/antitoxin HigA
MRIQPVRTEADHDAAMARITQLMGAVPGSEASDELEVLVTLVDAYEAKHFPIATPDPVAVIKFQMEQQGLSRKDLEPMIGSRARVSEILTGKRALTLPMIRRLHHGLSIPVDLLVGPVIARTRTGRENKRSSAHTSSQAGRGATAQQSVR